MDGKANGAEGMPRSPAVTLSIANLYRGTMPGSPQRVEIMVSMIKTKIDFGHQ